MAIGDGNNYGNQENKYDPTYYSRFRFARNNELGMSISYRSGLMILEINKLDDGFKSSPVESIYLSPTKAAMLSGQLDKFLKYRDGDDIDPGKAFGVPAGMGEKITYIGFSTDSDKNIFCTIGKFNGNGEITESARYEFSKDYNYALEWDDINANSLEKVFYNNLEIDALKQALTDFARSATGALGYGTLDLNRYESQREARKMDQVFDKLGIERRSYSGNKGNNNFLSNASSKSMSMDDVEDLLS